MNKLTGIFSQFERDELNKITAKSILEKLMNFRQNINVEFTARRLVWELIQNAKDNVVLCNAEKERVDIKIQITEDEFTFSHNKGFFTNEHTRGLIRKYSSSDKERDSEQVGHIYKTTGRFGTGFMTTHLLSEKVQVESYYKNDANTFNSFSFWLDRSGKNEPKIIEGINKAFDEAEENIANSQSIKLDKGDFKTSFTYPLSESKKALADITIEEAKKGVAYTLINVPEINSITIDEELIGDIIYNIEHVDTIFHANTYEFKIYNLNVNGKRTKNYYIVINNEEVQITIPISCDKNSYYALELDAAIPRLHLDFPMIGTEDLNLPFIVNSSLFEPTEPRDGVSLIDDEENEISKINCSLLLQAVNLYNTFLTYINDAENWYDLYNLARIKTPQKRPWIDPDWFKSNVVDEIRGKLLHTSIVHVTTGDRISILSEDDENQVYFPYAEKDIVRKKLWDLSKEIFPQFVPIKEHIDKWNKIIWQDCYKFSIGELSKEIQTKENLEELASFLHEGEKEAISFMNNYYELLNTEENHIKDILADEFAVIPNQLGHFVKKSELYIDKDIDEELINASSIISRNPREYLIHKKIQTGEGIRYYSKKQEDIITEINNILKEDKNSNIATACDYLASLCLDKNNPKKRTSIFEFSKMLYPEDFQEKRKLNSYDDKIWEESDKKSLFYIVSKIAEYETVERASGELNFADKTSFIKWLDSLVTFLVQEGFQNNINRDKHPILPNQNGNFLTKDNLFLDNGDIDEILKDISSELGYDFRDELLDISIFLELPENRIYGINNVAEKISSFIKPILRDVDKRKEHKETLKKFYFWMNENKSKADLHFSDLFEKRFLFLEDDDISLNMKKASEFDQLMEEHGIKSIEDLRIQLSKLQDLDNTSDAEQNEKINITKEILVSLGISSQEELEEAFKNPAISSRFYHTSTPTTDMFIYAQRLIERAKRNVIAFLRNHADYDCTDLEETAPTILAGIIKKNIPIQIVVRPSDNGEVIIYYSSEKDTLDSDTSELWVDNSIAKPHILTLGRILKSTGINRIPIKMN